MSLPPRSDRLEPTGVALDGMPLTPEDFFVFSRVDGKSTLGEVVASSGLNSSTAETILAKLIELGAVRVKAAEKVPAKDRDRARTPMHMRDLAAQRRREMLRAQFEASRAKPAAAEPEKAPEPEASAPAPLPETRVRLVPENDARLDASSAVPMSDQRLVLAIHDQIADLSHFDLMGIAPTNDKKAIRRAFHQVSRKFHPDSYFGKDLGMFGPILDALFKRVRASYELLTSDPRREAYVERLLADRAREHEAVAKKHQNQQEAKEQAKQLEVERKALEEQVRKQKEYQAKAGERAARAARDKARKQKLERRLSPIEKRNKKAAEHFRQGMVELDSKRLGAAASLFRLALDLDPENTEYEEHYQSALSEARLTRAARAYEMATQYEETGRPAEAAHYFIDAAEANPTPRHLAHAAFSIREDRGADARDYVLRALDGIKAAENSGEPLTAKECARVQLMCGFVFLAAGQLHSAKEQATAAQKKVGETDNVKALLASIKARKA